MRWLTVAAPGDEHELLLAAIDQHLPPVDSDHEESDANPGEKDVHNR
jgi:hypothetical protein